MDNESSKEIVSDLSERLTKARSMVEIIGKIPVFFSVPIRALMTDERNGKTLRPGTHFLVTRLLKSPSLKAAFYYAALTFRGDSITNTPYLSSDDLIRLFFSRRGSFNYRALLCATTAESCRNLCK